MAKEPKYQKVLTEGDFKSKTSGPSKNRDYKAALKEVAGFLKAFDKTFDDACAATSPDTCAKQAAVFKTVKTKVEALKKTADKGGVNIGNEDGVIVSNACHDVLAALKVHAKDWNNYVKNWNLKELSARKSLQAPFYEFTKKDLTAENIKYLDLAIKTPSANVTKMLALFDKHVKPGAKREINIASKLRADWETEIQVYKKKGATPDELKKAGKAMQGYKDKANGEISTMISQVFGRYRNQCYL